MSMLLVYMGQLQRGCCQSGLDAALQDTPNAAAWTDRGNNLHASAAGLFDLQGCVTTASQLWVR